jgi:hypothetical protein
LADIDPTFSYLLLSLDHLQDALEPAFPPVHVTPCRSHAEPRRAIRLGLAISQTLCPCDSQAYVLFADSHSAMDMEVCTTLGML